MKEALLAAGVHPLQLVLYLVAAIIMVVSPFLAGAMLRSQVRALLKDENPWPHWAWPDVLGFIGFWAGGLLAATAIAAGFGAETLAKGLLMGLGVFLQAGVGVAVFLAGSWAASRLPADNPKDRRMLLLATALLGVGAMANLGVLTLAVIAAGALALLGTSATLQEQVGEGLGNLAAGFTLRAKGFGQSQVQIAGRWVAIGKVGILRTLVTEGQAVSAQSNQQVLALVRAGE